jgi:hypothetical protein
LTKHLKYWTLILLFSFGLTTGFHYLLRPYWFVKADEHTNLTSFESIFTIALLPILLVTVNYLLAKKFDTRKFFIINAIIICSCIFLSSRLHFLNWADSVGSRDKPDFETLEVIGFERDLGLIVTTIGLIIIFVRVYKKRKLQTS